MNTIAIKPSEWDELAKRANYNSRELARLSNMSLRQLERIFRREFSCTPMKWLNERKVSDSRERLLAGTPVKVVALDLGYKHTSHFSKQFKEHFRMSPTTFVAMASAASIFCDVAQI